MRSVHSLFLLSLLVVSSSNAGFWDWAWYFFEKSVGIAYSPYQFVMERGEDASELQPVVEIAQELKQLTFEEYCTRAQKPDDLRLLLENIDQLEMPLQEKMRYLSAVEQAGKEYLENIHQRRTTIWQQYHDYMKKSYNEIAHGSQTILLFDDMLQKYQITIGPHCLLLKKDIAEALEDNGVSAYNPVSRNIVKLFSGYGLLGTWSKQYENLYAESVQVRQLVDLVKQKRTVLCREKSLVKI